MADKNSGKQVTFENGGVVLIGSDNLLNIVEGTLNYQVPGRSPIMPMDRGAILDPLPGKQRVVTGSLDVAYTSLIDTDGILPLLVGALVSDKIVGVSSGALFTFSMTVKIPDYLGATVGDQIVFAKCFLDPLIDYKAAAGDAVDKLTFKFTDCEHSPAFTRYA